MSRQQSQKRGKRSDAQKMASSRHDFDPIPATSKVNGAFGDRTPTTQHDHYAALIHAGKEHQRKQREEGLNPMDGGRPA
ncbi:MAG: hypothetical protein M3430_11715 [Acidobacteriota bacterium]|nr:hypothetical protein [Acidobacteriota bacterium]